MEIVSNELGVDQCTINGETAISTILRYSFSQINVDFAFHFILTAMDYEEQVLIGQDVPFFFFFL